LLEDIKNPAYKKKNINILRKTGKGTYELGLTIKKKKV
jgi:hypothetical protein